MMSSDAPAEWVFAGGNAIDRVLPGLSWGLFHAHVRVCLAKMKGEITAPSRLPGMRHIGVRYLEETALPQNLWVEIWGNQLRRFPQTPSLGFFPLTWGPEEAHAKPALRLEAAAVRPGPVRFPVFSASERRPLVHDGPKVTHEFC